ncbi:MAG: cytochrome c [Pseudomonadota bacterium]
MRYTRILQTGIVAASLTGVAPASVAQISGDPEAGQTVAVQQCAQCHAVLPGEGVLVNPDPLPFDGAGALAFEDIANTPGVTAMALSAWMTSIHPTMPQILLSEDDLNDVIAYILSLDAEQDI